MDGRKPGALGDGLVVTVTDQPVTSQRVRILWTAPADSSPLSPQFFGICAFSLWAVATETGESLRDRACRVGRVEADAAVAVPGLVARRPATLGLGGGGVAHTARDRQEPGGRGCLLLAVLGRGRSRRN
jgi:hypothetical protein